MNQNNVLVLNGNQVLALLQHRELEIMDAVQAAYQTHSLGDSCVPHSSFVRFPNSDKNRIIALPAYLGGDFGSTGIKWIASFPGNLELGLERASAVLVLNSTETGHLQAIMESSVVSAKRTAASAALAGHTLRGSQPIDAVGMIGCGLINFETFRFLLARRPELKTVYICDLDAERAEQFKNKCRQLSESVDFQIVNSTSSIFQNASVVTLATTAITPHISDISELNPNSVILHTSLRDLTPEVILSADNVVDDVDHVCRAQTSVHLAEQQVGHREFIRCTLGDILNEAAPARVQNDRVSIFSPFGLGVLDLAVAQLAYSQAAAENAGTTINEFLPTPWMDRIER
ncbi:2,3-diaminopropionate biosynthesis protein SbnB [Chloroflexi bacterium TSY]|nr:2,3-diaminopropionate biosynthesis protein SbnB [Chloroflexi bacterium TSY]